ncbi:GFA family protein [Aquibium oceanicum]|uniref:Guanylate cyclase domain-containing protein n=1 Tax=Aquibium oceanicum TaxID=1670800 RepID=A0A1L3SNT8_9HYPH|nr:GFA family protein [Aquibium oceanicum]APH71040.1 hypothetical protein BSQ44_06400 [Aquibium oceanicum]
MERKLAAIMAADVVGFSGLVANDEEGTLARLERLVNNVITIQIEAHRGRVFKTLGDGVLAEFSSTIEAIHSAIGIQKMAALDAHRSGDRNPLRLRIGVSVGDVVLQGTDLLGEGVNAAARLQAYADPGGIAISGEAMSQVRGKVEVEFEELGYKKLKENDAPVRVYKSGHNAGPAQGLFDFSQEMLSSNLIKGGCLCGSIRLEISMPPISTGYCHCRICQKLTGSAMSTWTAFPASAVHFPAAVPRYYASSPIAERGFCPDCGSSLTYRLIAPRPAAYLVVFTAALDEPQNFPPAVHGGIESRMPWLEILDDLPRTTCSESRVLQEAWSSVGLPDPQTWGPGAKPPKTF